MSEVLGIHALGDGRGFALARWVVVGRALSPAPEKPPRFETLAAARAAVPRGRRQVPRGGGDPVAIAEWWVDGDAAAAALAETVWRTAEA